MLLLEKFWLENLNLSGLPCAIQLEDNIWQRGEIIEIINENQVKVFCVDWGCILIHDRDALRAIPHQYTTFKAQVSKCFFHTQNDIDLLFSFIRFRP